MIVKNSITFITIQGAATKIANACHAAYWLHHVGEDGDSPLKIQERDIIDGFRDIAIALGYQPVPVVSPVNDPSVQAAE